MAEPQSSKQPRRDPLEGKKILDHWPRLIIMFSIMLESLCGLMFLGLRYGDEMNCGSSLEKVVCYLPGVDWLGDMILGTLVFSVIAFLLILPDKKVSK